MTIKELNIALDNACEGVKWNTGTEKAHWESEVKRIETIINDKRNKRTSTERTPRQVEKHNKAILAQRKRMGL